MNVTVLFDSSAWLEYFFGSQKGQQLKNYVDDGKDSIISTKINIFELYHKLLKVKGREEAERFVSFVIQKSFLDDLNTETLKLAAEEKTKLKLGMADAIILATTIRFNATLYTTDKDFKKAKHLASLVFL